MYLSTDSGLLFTPQDHAENRVVFYPGIDSDSNIKAVRLANTFIAGSPGSSKQSFMDNLVKNLIEHNSGETIDISIWDGSSLSWLRWFPRRNDEIINDRYLPHIKRIVLNSESRFTSYAKLDVESMTRDEFVDMIIKEAKSRINYLEDAYDVGDYFTYICTASGEIHMFPHIVIVDEYNHTDKIHEEKLIELLEISERAGIYVVIATQGQNSVSSKLLSLCKNRFCLRTKESGYTTVLGEEYAKAWLPEYGYCYYLDTSKKEYPELLKIPFYPNSFLRKFIGSYSVRR